MSGSFAWYVGRSAGLVAWVLLTGSVLWGLTLTTGILEGKPRPAWQLDLHRYLGGLATIFVGVHVLGMIADTYVHFGLTEIFVPFASTWRPGPIAWGVVGLYLLIAVELTSLARKRLPKRVWRATHFLSFPLFIVSTIHGLTAGTDVRTWFGVLVAGAAVAVVAGLTAVRIDQGDRARGPSTRRPTNA